VVHAWTGAVVLSLLVSLRLLVAAFAAGGGAESGLGLLGMGARGGEGRVGRGW